jgi:hypothetical protein
MSSNRPALVDAHDRTSLPHKVRDVKRDVAKTRAKIEHPHPRRDSSAGPHSKRVADADTAAWASRRARPTSRDHYLRGR